MSNEYTKCKRNKKRPPRPRICTAVYLHTSEGEKAFTVSCRVGRSVSGHAVNVDTPWTTLGRNPQEARTSFFGRECDMCDRIRKFGFRSPIKMAKGHPGDALQG